MTDIKTYPRVRSASKTGSLTRQINFVKLQQTSTFNSSNGFDMNKSSSNRAIPPIVTAAAWGIHDANTGELLWEKNADEQREMASLTKIMTCYLSCQLLSRFNEDAEKLTFPVTRLAAWICGTHSGLRENENVRVIDLLYGLMLPSGNDCAIALANGFGSMLLKNKKSRVIDKLPVNPVQEFVKEMNKTAQKIGLKNTSYSNPHGLSEKSNRSTVFDLGKLGFYALELPLVQKIASTQSYDAEITDTKGNTRTLSWKNTNKLLEKGFGGLKTGSTPNAGLCLSSTLRQGDEGVIVTLLNSKTDTHRFTESEKLARWALNTILAVKEQVSCLSDVTKTKITNKLIAEISRSW